MRSQLHPFVRVSALLLALLLGVLVFSGCNLNSSDQDDETPIATATSPVSGTPSVQIVTPRDGDEFVVNEPILFSVQVTNAFGLTQVELLVNGTEVQAKSPEPGNTETTKNFLLDYTHPTPGLITVRVQARRQNVVSTPVEIRLNIRASDRQVTATAPSSGIPTVNPNDPTCRAQAQTGLNLRRGPSTNFSVITTLPAGSLSPVLGRLGDNSWYQVQSGANVGWVSGQFVNLFGTLCTNVPIIAQPTATRQPTTTPIPTAFPTLTPVPTLTNTSPPAQPNLVVSSVSGPQSVTIPAGQTSVTAQYAVTITNQGGPVNTQFANQVLVLPGSQTFDAGVVANLNAAQSITLTNISVTFTTAGTFILQFQADNQNQMAESNEFDNNATLNVTVTNAGSPGSP